MTYPIAIIGTQFRRCLRIVALIGAGIAGLYLLAGLGAIIYVGRTSPEVQGSIAEVSSPVLRTLLSWIF